MARHGSKTRERARELYLTGETTSLSEIARRIGVKPHTVGRWKREEDWDGLRTKIDKRAAEELAERIASERVNLNEQHFKSWGFLLGTLFESAKTGFNSEQIRDLDKVAGILDRIQKGQRLARGLSLDGQTEQQIRAESEAELRAMVDLFIDVVREHVTDESTRDLIARAILDRLPIEEEATADAVQSA